MAHALTSPLLDGDTHSSCPARAGYTSLQLIPVMMLDAGGTVHVV